MRLLLDTATFLGVVSDASELSGSARELVVDPENDVYLSAVSAWEIAVKHALGRLALPESLERFVPEQRKQPGI
jgi:PIN domain nuclease of toxin-antitoxin system